MTRFEKASGFNFDRIAERILSDEPKIRESEVYKVMMRAFIDETMSCDVNEAILTAKSWMKGAIGNGIVKGRQYNRYLRIDFLVGYDMRKSLIKQL